MIMKCIQHEFGDIHIMTAISYVLVTAGIFLHCIFSLFSVILFLLSHCLFLFFVFNTI